MSFITKKDYLIQIDFDYLLRFSSESKIYRNYRKYFTKKDFVHALLRNLTKEQCIHLYNAFMSDTPSEEIAKSFLYANPTYPIIREKFLEYLEEDKENNEVIFFEFPVLNARTDITRINGTSYNYEIKSGRDKIERAERQMSTFMTLFEENIVICQDEQYNDVIDSIPPDTGVIIYEVISDGINFKDKIPARKSKRIDPVNQLNVMTVKKLREMYERRIGKSKKLKRQTLSKKILSRYSGREINEEFKKYLKDKYSQNNQNLANYYC